jgi:hypothetical protein
LTALDTELSTLQAGFAPEESPEDCESWPVSGDQFGEPLNGGCLRGFVWAAVIEGACLLVMGGLTYLLWVRN